MSLPNEISSKPARSLVIATNTDRFFLSHRLLLAQAAKAKGMRVICAAPAGEQQRRITDLGFEFYDLNLSRKGVNPFKELPALWRCVRLFRDLKPDLVHAFTLKPVVYLGLAHRFFPRTKMVATMTGLGSSFIDPSAKGKLLRKVIGILLKISLQAKKIVFQNVDDLHLFLQSGWVRKSQTSVIKGTGVDLDLFTPVAKQASQFCHFVYVGRLLKDKGLEELIAAFEILYEKNPSVRLSLFGEIDPGNPTSWTAQRRSEVAAMPFIEDIRNSPRIAEDLAQADVAVLPSYREGIPQSLMEAAASGLPLIATDVPGCREAVQNGVNGILVPAKNSPALFDAMLKLTDNQSLRQEMGKASREKAIREFDYRKLTEENIALYTNGFN